MTTLDKLHAIEDAPGRLGRWLASWHAVYSARLTGYRNRMEPVWRPALFCRAAGQAWKLTANGGYVRPLRETDVIGPPA